MIQKHRPTCVTVIGWAWILIGAFLLFPIVFFWSFEFSRIMDIDADIRPRLWLRIFPFLLAQAVLGTFGVMAAVMFLKRRSWARTMLEVLTWFCLAVIASLGVFWVWLTVSQIGLNGSHLAFVIFE